MIKRITAIIQTEDMRAAKAFYGEIFDMDVAMNLGWVMTMTTAKQGPLQLTFASDSGPDAPKNDLSIEVDDLDVVLARVRAAGYPIEYGPADEPWGVRRFFVRDPFGKMLNIMAHI